ncbi:MAG: MMPL family transporter [Thermoleophilia bacterium]|nr:MMPL family transporter [Thermoleophilia bacterium]
MESFTRWVLRFRWIVVAAWLALLVTGGALAGGLEGKLTNRFTLPGTDTQKTERILEDRFGQASDSALTLVARSGSRSETELVAPLRTAAERAARVVPDARVAAVQPVGDGVATATIVSKRQRVEVKPYTDDVRAAVGAIPGATLYVSGQAAIEYDLDPVFAEDLKVGELFIAVPIALLILAFTFGTLAFLLPFAIAAAAITTTLGLVWVAASFMELTTYLTNFVNLIGLGIAIDYSLLVVHRYREELRGGHPKAEAVVRTMNTAGRAIVFSGTAVAIGLALLLAMPLPFMRGFGVGGLLIPAVSVLAAVTLLPVLLYYLGRPLDRVRVVPRRVLARRHDPERNAWVRFSRWVMRRPLPIATAAAAVLVLLALPVTQLELGPGSNRGIPQHLESVQGLNVVSETVGEGALAPTEIVVDARRRGGVGEPGVQAALGRLEEALRDDREVAAVRVGAGPQFVDASGRYQRVQVTGVHEYGLPESLAFVDRLRDVLIPSAGFPAGVEVVAGGGPPSGRDFIDLTYGAFPWLVLGVLLLTYVLLVRAFRSLLLPLKAIVLNLLAIGAAYGILVIVFNWGLGESIGLIGFDQIEAWIPIMLFAMLFGLSMDYEVFLVTRMREEWDETRDNVRAVGLGLAKTGRIVTAAGLVMFAAFSGFVAGSIVGLQQFGLGLAAAILIDVTIVRALLVPSVMALFGRWNWWLPETVARLVRVPASPVREHLPAPALDPPAA